MRLPTTSAQGFRNRTIIELHGSGKTQSAIAALVGCTQAWVSKIISRYPEEGPKGLTSRGKAKGARARLDSAQPKLLEAFLLEGALLHGFATDNWARERIAGLVLKEFQVSCHPSHISKLMRKIGFSLQVPVSRSYRKDEKAVEEWKAQTLPAIKKSPVWRVPDSFCRRIRHWCRSPYQPHLCPRWANTCHYGQYRDKCPVIYGKCGQYPRGLNLYGSEQAF